MKPWLKVLGLTTGILLIVLLPLTLTRAAASTVIINAIYYDTYIAGEPEEAFQVTNVSSSSVNLTSWTITDFEGTVTLSGTLAPGHGIFAGDYKK